MLALLAIATVAAAPTPPLVKPRLLEAPAIATLCKPTGRYEIGLSDPALLYRNDGKARAARLGDLPKANHEKAVLRTIGGCSAPVVVRYQVGR